MRVGIFGNNLNQGYFLASLLRELGHDARVFLRDGAHPQDEHEWWSREAIDESLVERVGPVPDLSHGGSLLDLPDIKALYRKAEKYDVLLLREEGPALFSELREIPRVFASQGADLQLWPFWLTVYYSPPALIGQLRGAISAAQASSKPRARLLLERANHLARSYRYFRLVQQRQREGIAACTRLIIFPYQQWLADKLGVPAESVRYVPLPSTPPEVLDESAPSLHDETLRRLSDRDVVFLHPTRLFFLRHDGNRFLKDNDKLLRAFARFAAAGARSATLALFEKGRPEDIAAAHQLVRRLGIDRQLIWLPEMPNHALRWLFRLPNVVMCDQYSPFLNSLGNLGRESVFFGLPLITSYDGTDDPMYTRAPPNVLLGNSDETVLHSLHRAARMTPADRAKLREDCARWYAENLDPRKNAARYVEICREAIATRGARRAQ